MHPEVIEQTFEFVWSNDLDTFVRVTDAQDWEKNPDQYTGQIVRITTGPKIGVMTDVVFGQAPPYVLQQLQDLVSEIYELYTGYGELDSYLSRLNYVYGPPKVIQAKEIEHA
jgi:hypothetical protein